MNRWFFAAVALLGVSIAYGQNINTTAPSAGFQMGSLIINGDMNIDQVNEGASVAISGGGFQQDRWRVVGSAGNTGTSQRTADAPAGYTYSAKLTNTSSVTPTAALQTIMRQQLDGVALQGLGWGAAGAKSAMLDFCVKSSLTGNFAYFLNNTGQARSYVGTYNIASAGAWQCYSNVITGDTTGTYGTTAGTIGLFVGFDLGVGSNFQTASLNQWQAGNFKSTSTAVQWTVTNNATIQFAAVHLYPGSFQLPYIPLPYEVELPRAQKFYRKSFPPGTAPVQNGGVAGCIATRNPIATGDPSVMIPFDPPMQTTPTITTYNPSAANANWRDITAGADVAVSVDPGSSKSQTGVMIATSGTVTTLGDTLCIHYVADTVN